MKYRNNPFNIRYDSKNRWKGLAGNNNGFCEFDSIHYGIRTAAYLLMRSYRKRGLRTYAELINAFAPYSENPTNNYILYVCHSLHVMPFDVPTTRKNFAGMLHYMWLFEQGPLSYAWKASDIYDVICLYNLAVYESK